MASVYLKNLIYIITQKVHLPIKYYSRRKHCIIGWSIVYFYAWIQFSGYIIFFFTWTDATNINDHSEAWFNRWMILKYTKFKYLSIYPYLTLTKLRPRAIIWRTLATKPIGADVSKQHIDYTVNIYRSQEHFSAWKQLSLHSS